MGILDIFRGKKTVAQENNTLFGQTQLGNQIVRQTQDGKGGANFQLLYVTTSSTTNAGRIVDMSVLTRNSTVMSCVGVIARALSQCSIGVAYKTLDKLISISESRLEDDSEALFNMRRDFLDIITLNLNSIAQTAR